MVGKEVAELLYSAGLRWEPQRADYRYEGGLTLSYLLKEAAERGYRLGLEPTTDGYNAEVFRWDEDARQWLPMYRQNPAGVYVTEFFHEDATEAAAFAFLWLLQRGDS